jgi:hypothetical protein
MVAGPWLVGLSLAAVVPSEMSSLRLKRAEVLVVYEVDGACRVVQQMAVEPVGGTQEPDKEVAIVHTLALRPDQFLQGARAESEKRSLPPPQIEAGVVTRLSVRAGTLAPRSSFTYSLSYSVGGGAPDPFHCPLAVALATPADPHRTVSITLKLPSGHVPSGPPFPNFRWQPPLLVAEMGAFPAFLRVPFSSEREGSAGLSLHVLDLTLLAFLSTATGAWWMMTRNGRRG